MKADNSKNWKEMTLKCEARFLNCDKCEVKYPWYDPQDMKTYKSIILIHSFIA